MMISAFSQSSDPRIPITPALAKQYIQLGFQVGIEKDAGQALGFSNEAYEASGAKLYQSPKDLLQETQILLSVTPLKPEALEGLGKGALLIGPFDKEAKSSLLIYCQEHGISLFSMNLIPRISRAQSMDSLSSQANLAGYRAVLEAIHHYHRVVPMMMTAAGMIKPATVLILGAGVAGLQAIATAKRLGAVVYAFDVRALVKEQVESLGAEFIEVHHEQSYETKSGYADLPSEEYQVLQRDLIDKYAKLSDIVITTALIPGQKAPLLIYKKTIEGMKAGSILVDLATSSGGNTELAKPNKVIKHGEVTIIGITEMAGLVPTTASELFANNFFHLIRLLYTPGPRLNLNPEDDIIKEALLCHEGRYLPFLESHNA